jgi:hypothetical protein
MIYTPAPFNPYTPYDNQIQTELLKANDNFTILAQIVDYYKTHGFGENIIINPNITHPSALPYVELFIQSSEPSNDTNKDYSHTIPDVYTAWFNPADNKLKYYNGSYWVEVNWLEWVLRDPWYKSNRLRINNGSLEILGASGDWFKIYPSLGKVVEVYTNDNDTNDDSKIIHLMPGQTFIMRSKSVGRVAMIQDSYWRGYVAYGKEDWLMFKPSNQVCQATADCLIYNFSNANTSNDVLKGFSFKRTSADNSSSAVPFIYGGAGEFNIWVFSGGVFITAFSGNSGFETIYNSRTSLSPNVGYFLGVFNNRNPLTYFAITRVA